MPDSLILEWLDENSLRRYPLLPSVASYAVPTNLLLDAQITYRAATATIPASVGLASIARSGSAFTVTLTGSGQTQFTFSADSNTEFPLYVRNSTGSLLVFGSALLDLSEGTTSYSGVLFEPCTCLHMSAAWSGITGVTGNDDTPLVGEVRLIEGAQTGLDVEDGTLVISADRNRGLPVDCTNFFTEQAMAHDCSEGVATINGVGIRNNGDDFSLRAGSMVSLFPDNENHRIYIGLSFDPTDVCPAVLPAKYGDAP